MMPLLIKYGNIVLTTTTDHRGPHHLYLLWIVRVGGCIVNLSDFYSCRIIGKLTFFSSSGVQLAQTNPGGQFHFRRTVFLQQLKRKVGLTLAKSTALRINLNLDGAPGVQLVQTNPGGQFHFRRTVFLQQLKRKVGLTLAKSAALRINLNLDGAPITSKSHTHPSHSQTSRLLTSSLSLGVPVPRPTQCVRGAYIS